MYIFGFGARFSCYLSINFIKTGFFYLNVLCVYISLYLAIYIFNFAQTYFKQMLILLWIIYIFLFTKNKFFQNKKTNMIMKMVLLI